MSNLKIEYSIDKIYENGNKLIVYGWAVDIQKREPTGSVYININGKVYKAEYGLPRSDVSDFYKEDKFLNSGFRAVIDSRIIQSNNTFGSLKIYSINKRNCFISNEFKVNCKNRIYQLWIKKYEPGKKELKKLRKVKFEYPPKLTVIIFALFYSERKEIKVLDSILKQTYNNWEMLIVNFNSLNNRMQKILKKYEKNDSRIRIISNKRILNKSNAYNFAIKYISGDYAIFLDDDYIFTPNALFEIMKLLNKNKNVGMIYCDEDKINNNNYRSEPNFKPGWSPEALESSMYTGNTICYKTSIVKELDGFREEFEEARDWDFLLRFAEKTKNIFHIPKILFHKIKLDEKDEIQKENNFLTECNIRALEKRLERLRTNGYVNKSKFNGAYNICYSIKNNPLVSIIIPTAGSNANVKGKEINLLSNCINSIKEKTQYNNYEFVIVDNNNLEKEIVKELKKLKCRIIHYDGEDINIAKKMNLGAKNAKGEHFLFLNDDIEVITPEWLTIMLQFSQRNEVGVTGAKLYFEDETLQHVGVAFYNGLPDHILLRFPNDDPGYFLSNVSNRNYLCVTGACIMTRRNIFERVSGFDERFAINYNDVDFCLRVYSKGYRVVYAAFAELYHFQSLCRERLVDKKEMELFLSLWKDKVEQDPYYNINLNRKNYNFNFTVKYP